MSNTEQTFKLSNIISDVRFWLLLFFAIRLIFVFEPPLEAWHTWRQSTGLMVARNYLEIDSNFFYPRTDENHTNTGIIGMEFPIVYYIMSKLYALFGFSYSYGRLINMIITTTGIFYFYKIIKRFWSKDMALYAALILSTSLWFAFGRKTMCDTLSVALVMMGIYYGIRYLYDKKNLAIIGYLVFAMLGLLTKIPAGYLLIGFCIPFLNGQISLKRKVIFSIISLLVLLPSYYWYFIWNPHLSQEFGNWYNTGSSLSEGFSQLCAQPKKTLKRLYFDTSQSYGTTILAIIGVLLAFIKFDKKTILAWLLPTIIFILFMVKSGKLFPHHNYYALPYMPIFAFIAAYCLVQINKKYIAYALLAFVMIEGLANQSHDLRRVETTLPYLEIEAIVDGICEKDDLIAVGNTWGNPIELYFSHRQGWALNHKDARKMDYLTPYLVSVGCDYLFINTKQLETNPDDYPFKVVHQSENYIGFDMRKAK